MSIQMVGWVLDQHIMDPVAKLCLVSIANAHNNTTGQCNPSYAVIASEASCSRRTVIRKVQWLQECGYIEISEVKYGHRNGANSYRIVTEGGDNLTLGGGDRLSPGSDTCDTRGGDTAVTHKEPETRTGKEPINRRGARLPKEWVPSDQGKEFAQEQGVDWQKEILVFRDYWVAKPGQGGVKLDWEATWRNWIRKTGKGRVKTGAEKIREALRG